jgi:hypothetical protein
MKKTETSKATPGVEESVMLPAKLNLKRKQPLIANQIKRKKIQTESIVLE